MTPTSGCRLRYWHGCQPLIASLATLRHRETDTGGRRPTGRVWVGFARSMPRREGVRGGGGAGAAAEGLTSRGTLSLPDVVSDPQR